MKMFKKIFYRTGIAFLLILSVAGSVYGEENGSSKAPDPQKEIRLKMALKKFELEPTVQEVMNATLTFVRLHPEQIDELRESAARRAGVPAISIGGHYNRGERGRSVYDDMVPLNTSDKWAENIYGGSITFQWNLPELVFNPSELQTYALVSIQLNILKEVVRMYFVRRQLLLAFLTNPPEDPEARIALKYRIEEFTALLDAFTGGYFSKELKRRGIKY